MRVAWDQIADAGIVRKLGVDQLFTRGPDQICVWNRACTRDGDGFPNTHISFSQCVISDSDAASGAPLADTGPGLRVVWTGATGVGECVVSVRD